MLLKTLKVEIVIEEQIREFIDLYGHLFQFNVHFLQTLLPVGILNAQIKLQCIDDFTDFFLNLF